METAIYTNECGIEITVHFDDLQIEEIDSVDHSVFYICRGIDVNGGEYEATAEFCCGEFEAITDIERRDSRIHSRQREKLLSD